ncbi:MAG: DUF2341 domain-containing protein, partial [Candidatus Thorarchaeota archaeon]
MRQHMTPSRKHVMYACVAFVTIVLSMQLVAATTWTADMANAGPGVTIVQLSQDEDSDWATNDLVARLSEFIHDDPFFTDRISVIKTNNPLLVESLSDNIIIYVSHGGPLGIVTGKYLTPWHQMAKIIENSETRFHLFTACYSKNIIQHGSENSDKHLYTVPGARPAEVTNVEIVTTVMLAFGMDSESVDSYRTSELTHAKELVQSGDSVHLMDFEEIILSEIDNIDGNYSNTYTSDYKVVRYSEDITYCNINDFNLLHPDLTGLIMDYFHWYVDSDGVDMPRDVSAMDITYTKNYYYESYWIPDNPGTLSFPAPNPVLLGTQSLVYLEAMGDSNGTWVNDDPVFTGGTYSGTVTFPGDGAIFSLVVLNVTASGPTLDANGKTEVDSISVIQDDAGGTYIQQQKEDGVWQEPAVGRNPTRTGGSWTEPCIKADYEYDSSIPIFSGFTEASGVIHSDGESIYINSISTGTGWHGPSYVRTLPSYFKMSDMGSISVNFSMTHGSDNTRKGAMYVKLYDEDMNVAMALEIFDNEYTSQRVRFNTLFILEDGSQANLISDSFYGDTSGIVQLRYEPTMGVYADVPGENPTRLYTWTQIDTDRLIKYIVIQSYRYSSNTLNDIRINNIHMTYAGSEYSVFNDNCNDMDNFHFDSDFGTHSGVDGSFEVPTGESYITLTDVGFDSDWNCRKPHLLNAIPGAGTDYQIPITTHLCSSPDSGQDVYLGGNCKTDFSDVRFVSSDGVTFLDYWCESVVAGSHAKFWVKINDNLDYDQMIYIYYGNSAAESVSNGEATFIFFDDFSGTSLNTSKWNNFWTSGSGNTLTVSDGVLHMKSGTGSNYGTAIKGLTTFTNGYAFETRANFGGSPIYSSIGIHDAACTDPSTSADRLAVFLARTGSPDSTIEGDGVSCASDS